ncbi:MAG TPA: DUF2637 domain-containing protein [Micromonosporaceae bacterium]
MTRITSTLGAGAVAVIAAWSSWSHMVHVALRYGERPEVAYALPLSVDGLLVVASAAMVDDKRAGRIPRTSAKVAFAVGVVASLAANVAAAEPSIGARIVAGWPALALLLTVELLSRRGRLVEHEPAKTEATPTATSDEPQPASTAVVDNPQQSSAPVASTVPATAVSEPQPVPTSAVNSPQPALDTADESPKQNQAAAKEPAGTSARRTSKRPSAADRIALAVAFMPDATPAVVAAQLGLSERTVQRHWPREADGTVKRPASVPKQTNGREPALADRVGVTA